MKQNLDLFDWTLNPTETALLDAHHVLIPYNPADVCRTTGNYSVWPENAANSAISQAQWQQQQLGSTCPGICQPDSAKCGHPYKTGLCPGRRNIRCCPEATPNCKGQCQDTGVPLGLFRIVALYYRSSILYQNHQHIWCVFF
jgi:hypothetical protein